MSDTAGWTQWVRILVKSLREKTWTGQNNRERNQLEEGLFDERGRSKTQEG